MRVVPGSVRDTGWLQGGYAALNPDTLPRSGFVQFLLCGAPHNRKGAEGLALLAKETLGHDPLRAWWWCSVRSADRVKIVVWDGSGLVMYWKRLDGSGFKWPPIVAGVMRMNAAQLSALFDHPC
ncbi:transposase [Bradyrhizobium japonicum]